MDTEFARLQEVYETAGDGSLSREAWLALAEVGDKWTEYEGTRGELFKEIVARGLPTPGPAATELRATALPSSNEAGVLRGYDVA